MNVVEIVFSPTGGTDKTARIIGAHWGGIAVQIDLTSAKTDFAKCQIHKEDMVLIAMPSFGGRAPAIAIERLKKIAGNGANCTLVCVYGNRAYEDTLVEMEDAAKECGFRVVAAIAAVAEHSILPQYASGRPDASDEKQLAIFAAQIAEKAEKAEKTAVSNHFAAAIPGNRPYKKAGGTGLVPRAGKDCVKCGKCAELCPVQAVSTADFAADAKKCVSCMRCVKMCPPGARKVSSVMVSAAAVALKKACSGRKENELFL